MIRLMVIVDDGGLSDFDGNARLIFLTLRLYYDYLESNAVLLFFKTFFFILFLSKTFCYVLSQGYLIKLTPAHKRKVAAKLTSSIVRKTCAFYFLPFCCRSHTGWF